MSATMTSQKTGKEPCGCGGSATKTAASCNCGGSCGCGDCTTCQNQSYTRPLFFAGQLLTEDDLQQLTDYVVAKNRLHARYLAGSGVVCGLEVNCEPCGGGKVIVSPGYALDCCGNDIVLSCPQTLDINKMVRELKIKLRGGYDCGDPCAGSTPTNKTPCGGTSSSGTPSSSSTTNTASTDTQPPNPPDKYCLYINYCEQPTDPVSPYATDAPCGPTNTCQPTRCLEAFRFELRCPEECEEKPPICSRLWNCIGDPTAYERVLKDSEYLSYYGGRILEALERLRETPIPPIKDPTYWRRLAHETGILSGLTSRLNKEKEKTPESALRSFSDAVLSVSSAVALVRIQAESQQQSEYRKTDPKQTVKDAEEALTNALTAYRDHGEAISRALPSTVERAHLATLFELVEKIAPPPTESVPAKGPRVFMPAPAQLTQTPIRFLAAGAVIGPTFQYSAASELTAMRDWLIAHLEQAPQACCDLFREVCAVTIPSQTFTNETAIADARLTGTAAEILSRAVREVLKGCICGALNPPCPSCDDTGVLLACLTVENCQVKTICNSVREFVITPVNLRYWFPEIHHIGKEIGEWCCRCGCEQKEVQQPETGDCGFSGMGRVPRYVRKLLRLLCCECPEPDEQQEEERPHDCLCLLCEHEHSSEGGFVEGLKSTAGKQAVYEAVQTATVTLEEELSDALSEIETMKEEHKKLLERMARLEKKPGRAQPEDKTK